MPHDKPKVTTTPDPKLVEIFDYFFGVDLTQDKHFEGRLELAEYFSELMANSVRKFYADKPPQSNLILDIIWTWLIKNGVEVSEEAKDELERKVKGAL